MLSFVQKQVTINLFPEKYFDSFIKKKRKAPTSALNIAFVLELTLSVAVFAVLCKYFAAITTQEVTLSATVLPGQDCSVLNPRKGTVYYSNSTSENAQFASPFMKVDECVTYLSSSRVCEDKVRYDYLSVYGVSNPTNFIYYPSGAYSFFTNTTDVESSIEAFYNASSSFPRPDISTSFRSAGTTLFLYNPYTGIVTKDASSIVNSALYDSNNDDLYEVGQNGDKTHLSNPSFSPENGNIAALAKQITNGPFKLIDLGVFNGTYYGLATELVFSSAASVSVDKGGIIFVMDSCNGEKCNGSKVRRINPNNGEATDMGGGYVFAGGTGTAVDSMGNIFVSAAPLENYGIFKISSTGTVTKINSNCRSMGLTIDINDNVFALCTFTNNPGIILKIEAKTGKQSPINPPYTYPSDPKRSCWGQPNNIAVDSKGTFYITNTYASCGSYVVSVNNNTLKVTDLTKKAPFPPFFRPRGIAVDSKTGNVYVADIRNGLVRMIDPNFAVTLVGQNAVPAFSGPNGVAFDAARGVLFVADQNTKRIYRFQPAGNLGMQVVKAVYKPRIVEWKTSLAYSNAILWNQFQFFLYLSSASYVLNPGENTANVFFGSGLSGSERGALFDFAEYNVETNQIYVSVTDVGMAQTTITALSPVLRKTMATGPPSLLSAIIAMGKTLGTVSATIAMGKTLGMFYIPSDAVSNCNGTFVWLNTGGDNPRTGGKNPQNMCKAKTGFPTFKSLLLLGTPISMNKVPASPTRLLQINIALTAGGTTSVLYDVFTDSIINNNTVPAAATNYMLSYSYGVCNSRVTQGLVQVSASSDYSIVCKEGNGIYYQGPNQYFPFPYSCLGVPYSRLFIDCPDVAANMRKLVQKSCQASIPKVCSSQYSENPPFSCSKQVLSSPLTVVSQSFSNTMAVYGVFSLIIAMLISKIYKPYQPTSEEMRYLDDGEDGEDSLTSKDVELTSEAVRKSFVFPKKSDVKNNAHHSAHDDPMLTSNPASRRLSVGVAEALGSRESGPNVLKRASSRSPLQ